MPIVDGNIYFHSALSEIVAGPMRMNASRWAVTIPPTTDIAAGPPIRAFINHGRWCVTCPDCSGGEYVWLDTPIMMCQSCWNGAVNGKWRRVLLPPNRTMIENVLLRRPLRQNRNWYPNESVDQLKQENREHGLAEEG